MHDLLGPRAYLLARVGEASEQKGDGRGVFHHPEQVQDRGELVDIGPVGRSLDLADGGRCALLAPEPLGGDNGLRTSGFWSPFGTLPPRSGEIDAARPDRAAPRLLDHPQRAGIAFHGLGHVLKQLGDADPAVAVSIARASDAIEEVIGKKTVPPRLRLQ